MVNPTTAHRVPASFTCLFVPSHESGWDIYEDAHGTLHSISTSSPKGDSRYGSFSHMLKVMGYPGFSLIPTEAGARRYEGAVVGLPGDYFERIEHYKKMRAISPLNHGFQVSIFEPRKHFPRTTTLECEAA